MPTLEQLELFEQWLSIVDYEGLYEVSDWGRVRSLARARTKGGLLAQKRTTDGYFDVTLCKEGRHRTYKVHRLVAQAFLGPSQLGVDHIDGNPGNNILPNLRYATQQENIRSARERRNWIGHGKLTRDQIIEARHLRLEGMTHRAIAEKFGVARSTISFLLNKQTWKDLDA